MNSKRADKIFSVTEKINFEFQQCENNWETSEIYTLWREIERQNPSFFNGPIVEIENIVRYKDSLLFEVQESRFSHYLAGKRGILPESESFSSLAVNILPMTSDGYFLLAQTSSTSEIGGKIKFFGGAVEPSDFQENSASGLMRSLEREISEEFKYIRGAIAEVESSQILVHKGDASGYLIVFSAHLKLDSLDCLQNFQTETDPDAEIVEVKRIAINPQGIVDLRNDHGAQVQPYVYEILQSFISQTSFPTIPERGLQPGRKR